MFTSLAIKNFRGFKELKLEPLDRVNLIAGRNNTGKTALLEAIYLHCHPTNAQAAINVARLRGVHEPKIEDVAEWLFLDAVTRKVVEVVTQQESGLRRTSRIRLADATDAEDPDFDRIREFLNRLRPDYVSQGLHTLVMKYADSTGLDGFGFVIAPRSRAGMGMSTASLTDKHVPIVPVVYIGSRDQVATTEMDPYPTVPAENLLFNDLDAEGRQEEVLGALQHLEPRLRWLSFNLFNDKTVIHGDLEGVPRKVPLPFMGEGIRRLLLIVTAIANAKGGAVAIDEIDAGLHYSVLADVWKAVAEAARRLNVQVFATTHSWECIRTAHESFSQNGPYDFRLHRLDRTDGQVSAVTYDQETIDTSLTMGLEVR